MSAKSNLELNVIMTNNFAYATLHAYISAVLDQDLSVRYSRLKRNWVEVLVEYSHYNSSSRVNPIELAVNSQGPDTQKKKKMWDRPTKNSSRNKF
jgi:hypothetical protein